MKPLDVAVGDTEDDSDYPLRTDTASARALLHQAVAMVGSRAELARRLEVSASHVSRVLKGTAGLGVETCLRLANVLDDDPLLILRTCGYARLTDLLHTLRPDSTPRRRGRLHKDLERLSHRDRLLIDRLIQRLVFGDETEVMPVPLNVDAPKRGVK